MKTMTANLIANVARLVRAGVPVENIALVTGIDTDTLAGEIIPAACAEFGFTPAMMAYATELKAARSTGRRVLEAKQRKARDEYDAEHDAVLDAEIPLRRLEVAL